MKKEDGAKKILRALNDVDDSYIEEAADSVEKIQPVHSRRIVKFRRAVMIAAAAAACFAALLAVRMLSWRAGTAPRSSGSTGATEEDAAAAPNPIAEVGSLAEAEAIAGFDLTLPDAEAPYTNAAYAVIDGTMIDVTYTDDAGEVGLNIRKAPVTEGGGENETADSIAAGAGETAESAAAKDNETEDGLTDEHHAGAGSSGIDGNDITGGTDDGGNDADTNASDDISGDYSEYANTKEIIVDGISVTLRGNDGTWSVATWTDGGCAYAVGAQEHPLSEEKMTELIAEIK